MKKMIKLTSYSRRVSWGCIHDVLYGTVWYSVHYFALINSPLCNQICVCILFIRMIL